MCVREEGTGELALRESTDAFAAVERVLRSRLGFSGFHVIRFEIYIFMYWRLQ